MELQQRLRQDGLATGSIAPVLPLELLECQRGRSRHWADLRVTLVSNYYPEELKLVRTARNVQDARNLEELVSFLDLAGSAPLGDSRVVMGEVDWCRFLGPVVSETVWSFHVCDQLTEFDTSRWRQGGRWQKVSQIARGCLSSDTVALCRLGNQSRDGADCAYKS